MRQWGQVGSGNGSAMTDKVEAEEFLVALERALNKRLPPAGEMERAIRSTILGAQKHENQKHLRTPEAAISSRYALPLLAGVLRAEGGLSPEQARAALLNEYYRTMRELSDRSPVCATRTQRPHCEPLT
jgi:hypothetical protein